MSKNVKALKVGKHVFVTDAGQSAKDVNMVDCLSFGHFGLFLGTNKLICLSFYALLVFFSYADDVLYNSVLHYKNVCT